MIEIKINSKDLFHIFDNAIDRYEESLRNDIALQRRFIIAWNSIQLPIVIKPETEKSNEVHYLLTELGQSDSFILFQ